MSRRPRKRRPTRGHGGRTPNWVWGAVMTVAVIFAIGGVILVQSFKGEEVDDRLCPKASGPAAGLAVLLDLTDSLNPVQHKRLRGLLDDRIGDAKQGALIAVGAVRADALERDADFALCKPATGEKANELYQNPRMIEERYRKEFLKPFEAIVSAMMESPAADRSPIMESLQALLVSAPGFVDATWPRRVIIVSDLIQNSEVFSFYRGDSWRRFIRSQDAERLAGRLRGVKVEICRIPRPGSKVNKAAVDDFWVNYFNRAGASLVLTSTCPLGDL